jgi:UDP-N-acetylmuramyl pentapeptide phosphotransferase/UDP-N-acetylglucosamine-1-phosphate transferase
MGLGDHPMRTPLYGVLLVIAAVLLCWLVASTLGGWHAAVGYFLAIGVGAIGFVMTLRDLDNFPNWRR